MSEPSTSPAGAAARKPNSFHRDFATVVAGYVAGHGVLRLFAGILVGLGDAPRADLLLRWIPAWNALGWFVAAWGLYHLVLWTAPPSPFSARNLAPGVDLARSESGVARPPNAPSPASRVEKDATTATESPAQMRPVADTVAAPPADWKARLKDLQKSKNVEAMVDFQQTLRKTLPSERAERLDRRLGRWYTKHFQHVMLTGRAAELLPDVERVADYYAASEEFAYFREILPVVRQCAELKQSIQ